MFESRRHLRNRFIVDDHLFRCLTPLQYRRANFSYESLCLALFETEFFRDRLGPGPFALDIIGASCQVPEKPAIAYLTPCIIGLLINPTPILRRW